MVDTIYSLTLFFDIFYTYEFMRGEMTPEQEQILKNILETLKQIEQRLESSSSNWYVSNNNVPVKWLDNLTTNEDDSADLKDGPPIFRWNGNGWIKE